jgi:hypothetical protein
MCEYRVTVPEAAKILGTAPETLRELMKNKLIDIGTAYIRSSKWQFIIPVDRLSAFCKRDVMPEIIQMRKEKGGK